MTRHRFKAPGRVTNYEMESLRAERAHRYLEGKRIRYMFIWESLCDPDHPMSREDWERQKQKKDEE